VTRLLLSLALLLPGGGILALPEDADQPIHIEADRVEMDQNAGVVVYQGGVQANQGTMYVTADRMTVEYRDKKVVRIVATGEPAHYRQQLESDQGEVKARARTIVYHTQEERVQLERDAYLEQGGNEIAGELINYDIVAGRVNAESGEDGPVTVTVQPATRPE
jgi:lipopolysaccharide export system protein LptA